jgi:hypothetical protein
MFGPLKVITETELVVVELAWPNVAAARGVVANR